MKKGRQDRIAETLTTNIQMLIISQGKYDIH